MRRIGRKTEEDQRKKKGKKGLKRDKTKGSGREIEEEKKSDEGLFL